MPPPGDVGGVTSSRAGADLVHCECLVEVVTSNQRHGAAASAPATAPGADVASSPDATAPADAEPGATDVADGVADGRDMGTVIFPDAALKIFLTASAEARALRRYKQLKEKGESVNLSRLSEDIEKRDERDRTRAVAPLRPADDAHVIDSTEMSIEEVLSTIQILIEESSISL